MLELRSAMGAAIDEIPPNDPRRMDFDSLHRYSVMMMGVAIIAGLIAFGVSSLAKRRLPNSI
jgi:hypothetical protein